MDGKSLVVIAIALMVGCKSSEEARRDTITVPADTAVGWIYGSYGGVIHNDDCDSVEVFRTLLDRTASQLEAEVERYNVAIQALTDGYSVDADASRRIQDSLRNRVDYYRLKLRTQGISPEIVVQWPEDKQREMDELRSERDELKGENKALRENQITFGHDLKIGFYGGLIMLALLGIGYFVIKTGLIKSVF